MKDGWTKTPNKIYEAMAGMCEAELRVTMVLVRMTYGYQRESAEVEYADFAIHGGLGSKSSIAKGVKLALRRGFFTKGNGRSDYKIAGSKSTLNEPLDRAKSTLGVPLQQDESTLNEPLDITKSTLNEPFLSYKENKEREEEITPNPFPFRPVEKSDVPENRGPADKRLDAILSVCGLDRTIPRHLQQAENAAAQLSSYSAGAILDRYKFTPSPGAAWYWYRDDWRGQKGQQPKPADVVETISAQVMQVSNGRASPAPAELSEAMMIPHTGNGW